MFLAAFLYVFWRVGKYWPGVPQPTDGIFRLNQVRQQADHTCELTHHALGRMFKYTMIRYYECYSTSKGEDCVICRQ